MHMNTMSTAAFGTHAASMDEKLPRELEEPFEPTEELLAAIEEAIQIENDPNAKFYTSAEELFAALHA